MYKLTTDCHSQTTPCSGRYSQDQEKFLPPSVDRQTLNYDVECSNHYLFQPTLRPKDLSPSKIKWWAIYTNLPLTVIVRPPHPQSGDSQGQETLSTPFADKELCSYDILPSKHHPSLSTLRPKVFSVAIYTNILMNVIVRLPTARKRYSHHPSLSTLSSKELCRSMIIWWAIYTNLPGTVLVIPPQTQSRDSQVEEMFLTPCSDKQNRNYT